MQRLTAFFVVFLFIAIVVPPSSDSATFHLGSHPSLAFEYRSSPSKFAQSGLRQGERDRPWFARGINLSGAAFNAGRRPGIHGTDYIYPSASYLDYYKKRGFEVVRLPFLWERLQGTLFGELNRSELDLIKKFVSAARERNMKVILSPHNYGRYAVDGEEVLVGTRRVLTMAPTEQRTKRRSRRMKTAFTKAIRRWT
jgi:hypothetical protein